MSGQRERKSRKSSAMVAQKLLESSSISAEIERKSNLDPHRIENETTIYASMCPDEILDHYDKYNTRSYYTTLMFADVSGFTDIADKYTKSGKGGPSKLTDTLNSYIGAMVQEILSHNGDVLKFSGDAFIVMWKLDERRIMRDIASEAIKTACIIQKHFGTYETDVDVILKVKLAIASGKTYFTSIGDPNISSHYIITGKPVFEVKHAEELCRGGDILVAASSWQWINPNEYIYEVLPDGIHTLILSQSVLWENPRAYTSTIKDISTRSSSDFGSRISVHDSSDSSGSGLVGEQMFPVLSYANKSENAENYSLRPKLLKAVRQKVGRQLRCFLPRPVIRSVEMEEPLEYLTEIRQVVIVFVNVITENTNRKTLIKLINTTFLFVCSVVAEMEGCVNKTSLFDKGLIFLCIFGLRGDKHELESQIGLRCASKLRRGLVQIEKVKSVSVGVTTGLTYCGVVGHVLRREYTVIGMPVNKAARLMCAYKDKVICDRESFLLSHLEAKHFILQEAKYLKGITKVGPIYEFSEVAVSIDNELHINKYPLLGRDNDILSFQTVLFAMLKKIKKNEEQDADLNNILIIRGEPRMGKTRLLEEMTYMLPSYISVNFICLSPYDNQLPYVLLRLIFYIPLDITENATAQEKQEKLVKLLDLSDQWRLCALNDPFGVHFKISKEYSQLDSKARKKHTKRIIAKLTRKTFEKFWVIFIDDAELADDESKIFFNSIAKQKKTLFVASYGNKLSKKYSISAKIAQRAQITDLLGIDKWYQAALACQIMNVIAIPAELEKIIQERSSGNPGWIESFLISLLQTGGAVIKEITKLDINRQGLVAPPNRLLQRLSGDRKRIFTKECQSCKAGWPMYESSFRESFVDETDSATEKFRVCLLTPNFILEDIDTETTMDTILLKLYDSLTPLDQFLLKCAAVLGEVIERNMLFTLMEDTSPREIAICIVKLFELRIIGCVSGDFNRAPGPTFETSNVEKAQVRCGCKNVEIPDYLADLPYYAACRIMRFKLDMFRVTTYSLLTENQKVEFHSKALRYLQQNTRRCISCGGGLFNRLLGQSAFSTSAERRISITSWASNADENSVVKSINDIKEPFFSVENERRQTLENQLPFNTFKRIERRPTRTFSNVDFTYCECNSILLTAYTHILEHCRGIGVREILLTAILEFVDVCLSTSNIPQATKLLIEGDEIINEMYYTAEDELILIPFLKGKVQTLRGRCYLESGLVTEAMTCFEETMRVMRYTFPSNPIVIKLKSFFLLRRQALMLGCLRKWTVGVLRRDAANYSDQFASCLALMFIVFKLKGMKDHAKLAAIWGLNTALTSNNNFFVLCSSYANMMITAHSQQYKFIIPYLETDAINLCYKRSDSLELQELSAISELYSRIFFSRWLRGMTKTASEIGFIASRLAHALQSTSLKLLILPRIIQLLFTEYRFGEAVAMLQELEYVSHKDIDLSGRTWYCALGIDLLLESGISIVTLRDCEEFYQQESSKIMNLRDPEAASRFFISMWLCYVRIGNWESALVWKSRKFEEHIVEECTTTSAVTYLKKIEGLIICYVHKINCRNNETSRKLFLDIKTNFQIMEKLKKMVKIIIPRFLLMKAYWHMARLQKKSGATYLRKAKKTARELEIKLIYRWAEHCEKAWAGSLSPIQQEFWIKSCTENDYRVDWHEIDSKNHKILHYTLPLPINEI